MKKVTVSGKTVEEAVQNGLDRLEVTAEQVDYTVLEEPEKGFLGFLGNKPALVEVRLKPDPLKEALVFLRDTIDKMGITASVEAEERKEGMYLTISGAEIGVLIGKRGQTLDSLQYLVNLVANRQSDNYMKFYLDAEGYRDRRREALETLAKRLSEKAVRTGREVKLEPMNAHERKIIHTALQHIHTVSTYSEGREPHRRIVVVPNES
ncbi:RNA-binding cell elongation regulator Jag/EloR [Salisediminibacterium selenitireducens]|uniref:RNA-binding protein KhpB n=1 Tax=Bacillus selenitireducens (strain ATCC 700615 / DSM 15326 / MLS10) TaxID=439292 RepID=D6Y1L7_BACIE|nr:RNA-binding cell elongation regulator Jag/EloR [Salisediminibacterium selenitireducens]ADI00804.1 single-stranded nucleic acid binding R3H domain protein [[Bacillus] selenitireducens MLS10]